MNSERSQKGPSISRRVFLVGSAAAATEAAVLAASPRWLRSKTIAEMMNNTAVASMDHILAEMSPDTTSSITFIDGEGEAALRKSKSIVLDLPGQNYKRDHNLNVLTSLSALGVRANAELGIIDDRVDIEGLIRDLYRIRAKTGLETISWNCDSDAWPIIAQIIPRINHIIKTKYIFLNATPADVGDIKAPFGDLFEVASDYGPSAAITAAANTFQFGRPNDPEASSAKLAYAQLKQQFRLKWINRHFAKFLRKHNATAKPEDEIKIAYVRLQNPSDDTVVDEVQSIKDLRKQGIPLDEIIVGGSHQSHDNPTENTDAYNIAFEDYLASQGIGDLEGSGGRFFRHTIYP